MKKFRWMSNITGEIVHNIFDVIRVSYQDLTRYHIRNFKWTYNKRGY